MSDLRNDMEEMRRRIEARKKQMSNSTKKKSLAAGGVSGEAVERFKQMNKEKETQGIFNYDEYIQNSVNTLNSPDGYKYEIVKEDPDAKTARKLVPIETSSQMISFYSYNYTDLVLAANELLLITEEDRGGSFFFGQETTPETGFIVGDNRFSITLKVDQNTILLDLLEETIAMLYFAQVGQYHGVGTWLDEEESLLYVDPIMWFEDEEEAISVAMRNGEKAIFDCEANESLELY